MSDISVSINHSVMQLLPHCWLASNSRCFGFGSGALTKRTNQHRSGVICPAPRRPSSLIRSSWLSSRRAVQQKRPRGQSSSNLAPRRCHHAQSHDGSGNGIVSLIEMLIEDLENEMNNGMKDVVKTQKEFAPDMNTVDTWSSTRRMST